MQYLWICENILCNCIKIGCENFPIDYNWNKIYWLFQKRQILLNFLQSILLRYAIELIQQVKMN